jgi:hypothetical protein
MIGRANEQPFEPVSEAIFPPTTLETTFALAA